MQDFAHRVHGTNGLRRLDMDEKRFWGLSILTFGVLMSLYIVADIAEEIAMLIF